MRHLSRSGTAAALLLAVVCVTSACTVPGTVTGPLAAPPALPPLAAPPDVGILRLAEPSDRIAAQQARDDALERRRPGEQAVWRNRSTGNSGTLSALDTADDAQGRPCRTIQHVFTLDGTIEQADGTACRQPDGSWIAVAR